MLNGFFERRKYYQIEDWKLCRHWTLNMRMVNEVSNPKSISMNDKAGKWRHSENQKIENGNKTTTYFLYLHIFACSQKMLPMNRKKWKKKCRRKIGERNKKLKNHFAYDWKLNKLKFNVSFNGVVHYVGMWCLFVCSVARCVYWWVSIRKNEIHVRKMASNDIQRKIVKKHTYSLFFQNHNGFSFRLRFCVENGYKKTHFCFEILLFTRWLLHYYYYTCLKWFYFCSPNEAKF